MKKRIIALLLLSVILLSSCTSNKHFENRKNYDVSVELFTDFHSNIFKGSERYIYSSDKNKLINTGNKGVDVGAWGSFYCTSDYKEQIDTYMKEKGPSQLNDYLCIDGKEIFLYWNGKYDNYVFVIQNGEIKEYKLTMPTPDALYYCYHTKDTISFGLAISWPNSTKFVSLSLYTINLISQTVNFQKISIYDEKIEKTFSVNEQLEFPVEERITAYDKTYPKTIEKDNFYNICSPFHTMDGAHDGYNSGLSYWINKVNKNTLETENMIIVEGEKMLDFWGTDDGYALICDTATYNESDKNRKGVEALYITYYDKNLKQLTKEQIELNLCYEDSEVKAAQYENTVFIVESNSKNTVIHTYDLQTKKAITSKNKLSVRYDDFHIVKKQDGVIYHLGGLLKILL